MEEIQSKLMTAHHTLHSQSDIDRLYLLRRIWGRGLLQIRQTVEKEIRNLSEYISSTVSALKEVITEGLLTIEDTKKEYKRMEKKNRQKVSKTRRCMANISTTQMGIQIVR